MEKYILYIVLLLTISETNAQIEKIGDKSFLDQNIYKKAITINFLEKAIDNDSDAFYHNLLLNKAVRFKYFFDGQEYSSKLHSEKCKSNSMEIAKINFLIKNTFKKGFDNATYLLNIAEKKDLNFRNEYLNTFTEFKTAISPLLKYEELECNNVLSELKYRNLGIFSDTNMGNNILSFNYILNPIDEIIDGHTQMFSSINNAPDEDFYFTLELPKSWTLKSKQDFSNASTVGMFEAYEKFLNVIITASIFPKQIMTKEKMKSENITDNDILDFIYEDEEVLLSILKYFNENVTDNKINCTLFVYGNNKMILYNTFTDLGKVMKSEISDGLVMEYLSALRVKNGKIIKISGAGFEGEKLNSYDYYSKLFFKVLTSAKFKNIKKNTIYLTEEQNMKFLQLNFNGLDYKFMLDTGASNVVINKSVLSDLLSNGIINKENYIGDSYAEIADGSMITCQDWLVPELKIGNQTIKNLTVSVTDSENSMLLFGMDGLKKLNVLKLNLNENEIILNSE